MQKIMLLSLLAACGARTASTPATPGSGSGSSGCSNNCEVDAFTLDPSAFYDDGTRWWTLASGPKLEGTIEATSGTLQAYVGDTPVGPPATITGTQWTIQLPDSSIGPNGTLVDLRLTSSDAAPVELEQLIQLDDGKPTIIATGFISDERQDKIDFSTGAPRHMHAVPTIDLSGACPDVWMYPYLMDSVAPRWGSETSANPLAWQVEAMSPVGIDPTQSMYRVTNGSSTLVDWTALTSDTVTLYRDAIPALGTTDTPLYVDFKFHDKLGNEAIAESCVKYHPLAAPLQVRPVLTEGSGNPLWPMTFAADSQISLVIETGAASPRMYGQQFFQWTAEPVTVDVDISRATGSYSKTVADQYAKTASGTIDCGTAETRQTTGRCSTLTKVTSSQATSSGALASGTWSVAVIDEATNTVASVCTSSGLTAHCTIPGRAVGQNASAYRIATAVDGITDLAPAASGPYGEYVINGKTYTGTYATTVSHCDNAYQSTINGVIHYMCTYGDYAHFKALAAAKIDFDPYAVSIATSVGASVPTTPITYAPSPASSAAMTWDAGTASLP